VGVAPASVWKKKTPPPFQDERLREGEAKTLAERQQNQRER